MDSSNCDRRRALSLMATGAVAASFTGWPKLDLAKAASPAPWLATPAQVAAEKMLLQVEGDPAVRRIQARLRTELAATPRALIPDAAATLDNAIGQITRSLIFGELMKSPEAGFLWGTDDTSRTWLGHTIGGVGTAGDNPDAIYHVAMYYGNGDMIEAFDKSEPVRITPVRLDADYWGARRYLDQPR